MWGDIARALTIDLHVLPPDQIGGALTHDPDEALEPAGRVAVLNQGRIEQIGRPGKVFERLAVGRSVVLRPSRIRAYGEAA